MVLERKADLPATTSCETSLSTVAKFCSKLSVYTGSPFRASNKMQRGINEADHRRSRANSISRILSARRRYRRNITACALRNFAGRSSAYDSWQTFVENVESLMRDEGLHAARSRTYWLRIFEATRRIVNG